MSQPSSQTTGYRQYGDMSQKPSNDLDMGIYSVGNFEAPSFELGLTC